MRNTLIPDDHRKGWKDFKTHNKRISIPWTSVQTPLNYLFPVHKDSKGETPLNFMKISSTKTEYSFKMTQKKKKTQLNLTAEIIKCVYWI